MTRASTASSALTAEAQSRPANDPIFALNGEARRRAAAGESVLNATLGALFHDDGRLAVLPCVEEAFRGIPSGAAAGYAPISGDGPFRDAVIHDALGPDLAPYAVAVATPGGTGAIHHAFLNFLEPGQDALLPSFFWGPYSVIANHGHRGVRTFPMFSSDLGLDLEGFAAGLDQMIEDQGRALVIFNFPCNNPTGYALDDHEWSVIVDLLTQAGRRAPVALLFDHAYVKFHAEATSSGWRRELPRLLESVTVLIAWTASKSFTQYGARVGALIAIHEDADERGRLANALNYSCRATWSNCNHRGLLAVTELLSNAELTRRADEERAALTELLGRRVRRFNDFAGRAGLRYPRYESGFFVTVLTDDGPGVAARMREDGVFVVPLARGVRVALCATPESEIPRLVDALRDAEPSVRGGASIRS